MKDILKKAGIALIGLLVIIQFLPIASIDTPSAPVSEPAWDSPATRATFMRSCGDCHSTQTVLPWYGHVAPVSWFLGRHINEGREHLNVSAWPPRGKSNAHEAAEEVSGGSMPLKSYLLLHPEARLTDEERREFAKGLEATFGTEHRGGEMDEEEDNAHRAEEHEH